MWNSKKYYIILSVCVALGIQHAMHMLQIVNYGLPGSELFFHVIP